ncbi:MAG TPA: heparinase II/III-family protein, partial [Pyrinomonadaceae bacterium]|nr:heparinase II/III-family protein [Pyrinomonadaceae bacterium]
RTILVDPGTYTYTGASSARDRFRSSPAHNTLTVDGQSSSEMSGPFTWKTAARSRSLAWHTASRFDYFEGEQDGYRRLSPPVEHRRAVLFLKGDYWVVRDRVESAAEHLYELHFHFAPDAAPRLDAADDSNAPGKRGQGLPLLRERRDDAPGLDVYVAGDGGAWREVEGEVSPCYGATLPAPVFTYAAASSGAAEFYTFLLPRAVGERSSSVVREVEAEGGRAFELKTDDAHEDLLLTRACVGDASACVGNASAADDEASARGDVAPGEVRTSRASSDFAWAWARLDRASGALLELVLIDGTTFRLDGREVFASRERVASLALKFDGGRLVADDTSSLTRAFEISSLKSEIVLK